MIHGYGSHICGYVSSSPSSFMVLLDDSKIWTVFDFLVIGLPYVAR
jgi:hypothetical protein